MTYLIENEIIFNPEDNSLSLLDDSESKVAVSNPARRILLLLIEQQGIVVSREAFFKNVWDDYGLTASNNNLNHCISKLRKVISTLGYHNEFIVTVPKVGFIIRKEISVEPYLGQKNHLEEVKPPGNALTEKPEEPRPALTLTRPDDGVISPAIMPEHNVTQAGVLKGKHPYYVIMSLLVTTALAAWAFFILYNDLRDPKSELQIVRIGACDLYSTEPIALSRRHDFVQLAENFLHKNNIACKPGDIFIFESERFSMPINTGSVRDFMAQCSTDDNHKINICMSYYANDRTTHDR